VILEKEAATSSEASEAAFAALGSSDADASLRKVVDEHRALSRSEADLTSELQALGADANNEVERAQEALEGARQHLREVREAHQAAVTGLRNDLASGHWTTRLAESVVRDDRPPVGGPVF
jgi:hypothetical protein